jgi:catecholate siderophore receptor
MSYISSPVRIFIRGGFFMSTAIAIIASGANAKESTSNKVTQLPQVTVTAESVKREGNVDGYKTGSTHSSTRTDTPLLDVPQSISVVTQDQIRDQNISSMEEAVRYVPGVNIQQGEGNRDQITIRGNVTTADFFIDGARDDAQYFRDFYNIDRIEFLKGPNAMAFGRGGSGGLVNRVSKIADDEQRRKVVASGGSFNNRRFEADFGDKVNNKLSLRVNTMYEKSSTFRKYGDLERYGFNPTATLKLDKNTDIKFGYEHFSDNRFSDRGIPSSNGAAYKISPSNSFFGNSNENEVDAKINSGYATITHKFNPKLQLKNYTRYTQNSKFYQNTYASSSVNSAGNLTISAYNDEQERNNFTNQTDLTQKFETGSVAHTALVGSEITRQDSKILRKSGFFNNTSSTETLSISNPISSTPITYRTAGSDNDNSSKVRVYAAYIQDQIDINKYLQITGGLRYDNFEIDLLNKRDGQSFKRTDNLISPRVGIVLKPQDSVSIYTSYSVSYLPSAGDQFNSLSASSQTLKPEQLDNYEIGAKWDVNPKLNLSTAIYQLDRTNTRANDPNNPGFFILTGESRTRGIEIAATGKITDKWQIIGGYTYQDAVITSTTSSAAAGKKVGLVPHNTFSLWNKYDFNNKWAAALGAVSQSDQYATVDNTVRLKGFTRFDGAAYYKINPSYRLQFNVENIFDRGYIQTAHNNNNIQPGSPRAFKVSLVADF